MLSPSPTQNGASSIRIERVDPSGRSDFDDMLAVEEPLEIRIGHGAGEKRARSSISITMRTPGEDFDLALGFLVTEGIVHRPQDVKEISHGTVSAEGNVVNVDLQPGVEVDLKRLERHFYTTSSCGVCGKGSIEALRVPGSFSANSVKDQPRFTTALLNELPERLRKAQGIFAQTGGLHASALFDVDGHLIVLREDVGRHNALDKVIGHMFAKNALPLDRHLLLVSGRASFELIQKAFVAGIRMVAAIGAPSSLAIELAKEKNMTVVGFLRAERFNLYCGFERVV